MVTIDSTLAFSCTAELLSHCVDVRTHIQLCKYWDRAGFGCGKHGRCWAFPLSSLSLSLSLSSCVRVCVSLSLSGSLALSFPLSGTLQEYYVSVQDQKRNPHVLRQEV